MNARVEFLLDQCINQNETIKTLRDMIREAAKENGMEGIRSVLPNPEYQNTIAKLLRQIDKQVKWLDKRKEEVSILQNSIREHKDSRDRYKQKFANAQKTIEELNSLYDFPEPPVRF